MPASKKEPTSQASSPLLPTRPSKTPSVDGHHKQFVLLQPKKSNQQQNRNPSGAANNNSNPNPASANVISGNYNVTGATNSNASTSANPDNSNNSIRVISTSDDKKKKKLQKMPITPSKSRFIFSVDDGEDEIEQDLEREYLEGYNDALRGKLRKKLSKTPLSLTSPKLGSQEQPQQNIDYAQQQKKGNVKNYINNNNNDLSASINNLNRNIHDIETNIAQNLIKVEEGLRDLEVNEDDLNHHLEHGANTDENKFPYHRSILQTPQEYLDNLVSYEHSISASPKQTGNANNSINGDIKSEAPAQDKDNTANANIYDEEETGTILEDPVAEANSNRGHDDDDDNDDVVDDGGNGNADAGSISSMESFTLRERQDAINTTHPFGIRIWKPAIYKKFRSVQKEADLDIHEEEDAPRRIHTSVYIGNMLWTLTFGLVAFLLCLIGSLFAIICFGWSKHSLQYSRIYWKLGLYLLRPFGKIVYLYKDKNYLDEDLNEGSSINEYRRWISDDQEAGFFFTSNSLNEQRPLLSDVQNAPSRTYSSTNISTRNTSHLDNNNNDDDNDSEAENNTKIRLFGRGQWNMGRICFFIYFYLVLQPVLLLISAICWLLVFTIPMSKVTALVCSHLRQRPLSIFFQSDKNNKISSKEASVLVCTYRASGLHYYKYTVDGTNIIILNLMAMVFFVIFDFYFLKEFLEIERFFTDSLLIFIVCLLSIIPLAYFIGQAVASISAQSSMGLGAVINAFFSTIVEIFLYCVALNQKKGLLVEGSMIGSVLGAVLLLPGLSMCAGAIKRKTQRYNPRSAGVSSTMLLFSTVVMFTPTIFHQIFGSYDITCIPCNAKPESEYEIKNTALAQTEPLTLSSLKNLTSSMFYSAIASSSSGMSSTCQKCHVSQPPLKADKLYLQILKPFSIFAVCVLFFSYGIALWFTLRTHAALIWQTPTTSESRQVQPLHHHQLQLQQHSQQQQQQSSVPGSTSLQPIRTPRHNGLQSPSLLSLSDSAINASANVNAGAGNVSQPYNYAQQAGPLDIPNILEATL